MQPMFWCAGQSLMFRPLRLYPSDLEAGRLGPELSSSVFSFRCICRELEDPRALFLVLTS